MLSMGRLTLNIPLSLAQFERDIIGERIRKKVRGRRLTTNASNQQGSLLNYLKVTQIRPKNGLAEFRV